MPAWLWRDWLGPPAWRGPRWLLGRRPRRRLLPPPPEGLPDPDPCPAGPAFIVLSKPARSGFRPATGFQKLHFQVPHWLRQALIALAHSHSVILLRNSVIW